MFRSKGISRLCFWIKKYQQYKRQHFDSLKVTNTRAIKQHYVSDSHPYGMAIYAWIAVNIKSYKNAYTVFVFLIFRANYKPWRYCQPEWQASKTILILFFHWLGGICAPSHKVSNDYAAPLSLQPWYDCICPSHQHTRMPFCSFRGQSSTTGCGNAHLSQAFHTSLEEEKKGKYLPHMKSRKVTVSYTHNGTVIQCKYHL